MREPVGLILAGGQGTRMGGVLKADVMLGARRLLDHVVERFEPQVASLLINANVPISTTFPCVPDMTQDARGPLDGVLAGMNRAALNGASHVVSVAVDTPFLPCDLVPQLMLAGDGGLAVAKTTDGLQGTFALWPVTLQAPLGEFLNTGGRKVRQFLETQGAATATFPDTTPPLFFNINTSEDLGIASGWV